VLFSAHVSDLSSAREGEGWLACLDNSDRLQQLLGLSDKDPIPDPITFPNPDPLGAAAVPGLNDDSQDTGQY